MIGDKPRMGYTITVRENQIVTLRDCDGLVQDDGLAETVIGVPDMPDRQPRAGGEGFDDLPGRYLPIRHPQTESHSGCVSAGRRQRVLLATPRSGCRC